MSAWSITLQTAAGTQEAFEACESEFVVGSQAASDVWVVPGAGVAARHAWVRVGADRLQIETLEGTTQVNGNAIAGRTEVPYPAAMQIGDSTLLFERAVVQQSDGVSPLHLEAAAEALAVTIPVRRGRGPSVHLDETLSPQTSSRAGGLPVEAAANRDALPELGPNEAGLSGKYTLVVEIARGGMGRIFRGEDVPLKRHVAVKVSSLSQGEMDPRFEREAQVLAQLAHPNIVPIHALGFDGQRRPYYSMKLVEGRTLQAILDALRDGDGAALQDYPRARLLTIFRKVCDAMAFAHSKRILHRDLKPENIMVGAFGEVLVMDWGLAKNLGDGDDRAGAVTRSADTGNYGMTMEGDVMGTPQYMSPEQAEGMVAGLDERSDIYSLGGILYALLTLRPPVEGKTLQEVLTKVKSGQISSMMTRRGDGGKVVVNSPAQMDRSVPEALRAVTMKAMALDRSGRYPSVEGFASDIEAYQNGFATAAENAGTLRQMVLFVKRHKALSAVGVSFLVAVVVFVARLEIEKRQARFSERIAMEATEHSRREEAHALMALAEAAEESEDPEQMRAALFKVPEDMRDATWEYLYHRSDQADFKIAPPDGVAWVAVDKCPDHEESVTVAQANGQLSVIHTGTGEITPLWRAERKGFTLLGIEVDGGGNWVALIWRKANLQEVEIRQFRSGQHHGSQTAASFSLVDAAKRPVLGVGGPHLVVNRNSGSEGWNLEVWEIGSGKKVWARAGIQAFEFSKDFHNLFVLNSFGELESLATGDGSVQSKGDFRFPAVDAFSTQRTILDPNSKGIFSDRLSATARYDWNTGNVKWEARYEEGKIVALQLDPTQSRLGYLTRRSALGAVFGIRSAVSGALMRTFPIAAKIGISGGGTFQGMAAGQKAFAAAFSKRILVWRTEASRVTMKQGVPGAPASFRLLSGGSQYLQAVKQGEGIEVALRDAWMPAAKTPPLHSMMVPGFPAGRAPFLFVNHAGSLCVLLLDGSMAAYRIEGGRFEEVLPAKRWASPAGGHFSALEGKGERILVGTTVYEVASGAEVSVLRMGAEELLALRGAGRSVCWIGADRLVGPVLRRTESAAGEEEHRILCLWNAVSGELETQAPAPRVSALAVSPDGKWIAEGGSDRRVRIRDAQSLEVDREFRVHDREVTGLAWHPRLPLLVTACLDGTVRIWNSETGRFVEELRVDPGETVLEISRDGVHLVVIWAGSVEWFEPGSFRP